MTQTTKIVTTTSVRRELDREALLELLFPGHLSESLEAGRFGPIRIFIDVPGGGDYSNERLDVGTDVPLVVEFQLIKEEIE